jgi:SAM-dependent methyltransferase
MANDFQLSGRGAAERYDSHVLLFMEPFVVAMLKHAALQANDALLDVACGTGAVAGRVSGVATVVGADLNEAMLATARQRYPDGIWKQASAEALPFEDETFDVVTCQQGMQFFGDVSKAAKEMRRVLKPGGRVVATVWAPLSQCPYFETQFDALEAYVDQEAARSQRSAILDHADIYLNEAFTQAGFQDLEIEVIEAVVNLPDIATYAQQQVLATPWGQPYENATKEAQEAFGAYFRANLGQYAQEDGTYGVPFASYLAIARK